MLALPSYRMARIYGDLSADTSDPVADWSSGGPSKMWWDFIMRLPPTSSRCIAGEAGQFCFVQGRHYARRAYGTAHASNGQGQGWWHVRPHGRRLQPVRSVVMRTGCVSNANCIATLCNTNPQRLRRQLLGLVRLGLAVLGAARDSCACMIAAAMAIEPHSFGARFVPLHVVRD